MKRFILFSLIISVLSACTSDKNTGKDIPVTDTLTNQLPIEAVENFSQQDSIKATGRQVLTFFAQKNYPELIKYFSDEGVRFIPYGFIDTSSTKSLSAEDFLESINKKWVLTWGSYDGTGDPIKLSVADYLKKFVYNHDYLNAEATGFDAVIKQGNSINNIKEIYPNHHFIDYHFSGFEQKYSGMDWSSLRLVFEKQNGQYFVVAIIHDQWTS